MLRQAAEKTGDMVGEGTSTSTILAHAIFADGVRNVVAGASAIDIKRGLDRATKRAIETLRALSRPVATSKEKAQVAAISAHTDRKTYPKISLLTLCEISPRLRMPTTPLL